MPKRSLTALIRVGAFCGAVAFAASAQEKTIVLKAARIFDGHDVKTPGVVIVSGSVITSAGSTVQNPVGAEVIDLGDATLSPGFIDAHTHLSFMYHTDYRDDIVESVRKPIPEQALFAAENLKKTLMAGVTSVRDVGSRDFVDVGLRNAAAAGVVPGPRMLGSVHSISSTEVTATRRTGCARGSSDTRVVRSTESSMGRTKGERRFA